MTTLAKTEQSQLAQCEEVIERGLDSFIEVGNALLQIRESRLYRNDHDSFEDYCRERWEMVASRARQLIGAAQVIANLGSVTIVTPANEAQTRPLAALPAPAQREAWKEAVESSPNGKPTAKHVVASIAKIGLRKITIGLHGKVHNSAALKQLKATWNEANKADKAAFKTWITTNP